MEALVPEEEGFQDPHEDQHNAENDTQNLNKSCHAPYCAPESKERLGASGRTPAAGGRPTTTAAPHPKVRSRRRTLPVAEALPLRPTG
ncbi:hypothetical protein NicSoilB4_22760 [Arthrobacter sp. NicSoilB4]|nr:hypothetical protein NicSoilB4_22760 [Arthrobacter sp. NicSoilB4]